MTYYVVYVLNWFLFWQKRYQCILLVIKIIETSRTATILFQYVKTFSSKNIKQDHKFKLTYFCTLDHAYEVPLANIKMECQRWPEIPLILGRPGVEYVAMVTKLLIILWSTFSRILLQRIKPFWYKWAEISPFILSEQNLVECMTSSLG